MPSLTGLLESSLYVEDVARSTDFYQKVLGFEVIVQDDRFCALNVAGKQVLLVFRRGATTAPMEIPGGIIPPHDGGGTDHLAFSISAETWDPWSVSLTSHGVVIESVVEWPRGGRSLYFRDPDQHLVELVTPGCWPIY